MSAGRPRRGKPQQQLISVDSGSGAAEAYRVLRTNLQFCDVDQGIRRLLLTSSTPGEGKSTTAANLAVSFAQIEKRVTLVDADLRQPYLHLMFGVSNLVGLTSVLLGRLDSGQALRPTGFPGLSLLPSGPTPPNPAEMIGATDMQALLDELSTQADLLVIDSPPVGLFTDACLLAPLVDGVLLVVGAGQVSRDHALQAKRQLEAVRARVLGVVLNAIEPTSTYYRHYYYQGKA